MLRNNRHVHVVGFLSIAALAGVSWLAPVDALAQTQPRPPVKGRYKLKIDSSPQQAALYWDSSAGQQPKLYGIAGYTPITIKVPKGAVKIVLDRLNDPESAPVQRFLTTEMALRASCGCSPQVVAAADGAEEGGVLA